MIHPMLQISLVAFGSALGGVLRWIVSMVAARWLGTEFPFGTLIINLVGSFILGWFLQFISELPPDYAIAWFGREELRLAIAVGFIGAFTTFSTFEWESHALLCEGSGWASITYLIGSVVLGLLAIQLGVMLSATRKL